jgi:hypothetical protein
MVDSPTHEASPEEKPAAVPTATPPDAPKLPQCGIIMPIGDTPGYDPGHWLEVRRLIARAAKEAGYNAGMVSENDGQDVIHRSIVKNIYHNPLVVCDVSSLNPNVMLELGLRMANKKPLIVVFDGEGVYPFDIKNMLYIPYPKGLHHFKVENFVQELTARMLQVTAADQEGKYEPFLNHFNDVVIEESRLGTTTQSMLETLASLVEEVKGIKSDLQKLPTNRRLMSPESRSNSSMENITDREATLINSIIDDIISNLTPSIFITRREVFSKVRKAYIESFTSIGRPVSETESRFELIRPAVDAIITGRFPA